MKEASLNRIKLVITVALTQEIPLDWVRALEVPVITLKSLKAGGLTRFFEVKSSILFVITGVGIQNSKEAAQLIVAWIKPKFVINYGTTGNVSQRFPLGNLIMPSGMCDFKNNQLNLDSRIPIPYSGDVVIHQGKILLTTQRRKAVLQDVEFVDMEAFYQADVFCKAGISFHVVKSVSDYVDEHVEQLFQRGLVLCRDNLKKLFWWLDTKSYINDFSVIIPVYNRHQCIKRAIDSVLNQTIKVNEIIVVDDGSTDGTYDSLEEYGDKISLLRTHKNQGVSFSRNLGVYHSRSSWIAFLDSDDEWHPQKMENQIEYLKRHPNYEILQSEEQWIRNGAVLQQKQHHKKREGWIWDISLERCMIASSSVLIRKELFNRFLGFDDKLPACEDYDLWLRISRFHPVGLDDSVMLKKYGGHEDQLSTSVPVSDQYRVKALLKLLEKEKNDQFKHGVRNTLLKKIEALLKGYQKHKNWEQVQYYENLLASIQKHYLKTV